uniref:Uncharacterized protein n=1 Tax=Ananas comosus var. bracteatus TaxID=296719 RepID=A0A6V7PHC7_ANACO|nr:unnamed protein product [Ananas comosus var. bracteatus]
MDASRGPEITICFMIKLTNVPNWARARARACSAALGGRGKMDKNIKWWSMYICLIVSFILQVHCMDLHGSFISSSKFSVNGSRPVNEPFSLHHNLYHLPSFSYCFPHYISRALVLGHGFANGRKETRDTHYDPKLRMKDQICSSWFAPVGSASDYPLFSKWVIYGELACNRSCPHLSNEISPLYSLWAMFIGLYITNYVIERSTGYVNSLSITLMKARTALPTSTSFAHPSRRRSDSYSLSGRNVGPSSWSHLLPVAPVPVSDVSFRSPPRCRSISCSLSGRNVGPSSWSSLLPVAPFPLATLRFGLFIPSGHANGSDSFSRALRGLRFHLRGLRFHLWEANQSEASRLQSRGQAVPR